ncbi:MAG: FixH family protein [Nannocystaceae bacterium]
MLASRLALYTAPLAFVLAMSACDGDDAGDDASNDGPASICDDEDRVDDFVVNLAKDGARHTVTLVQAEPAEPIRGDNAWTVMITDASGAAMEGIALDARPWMPDHGHGSAVEESVTELGAGEYEIEPLNLFMAGLWEVTLVLTDADGEADEVMFAVCVE